MLQGLLALLQPPATLKKSSDGVRWAQTHKLHTKLHKHSGILSFLTSIALALVIDYTLTVHSLGIYMAMFINTCT